VLAGARFSAYVKGGDAACDYIVASTHPRSPDLLRGGEAGSAESRAQLRKDAIATCKNIAFRKLTILKADRGATEQEAWVSFRATYNQNKWDGDTPVFKQQRWREAEASKSLAEKSRFLQDQESKRWLYFNGTLLSPNDLGAYNSGVAVPVAGAPAAAAPAAPPAA
jgi:uncharacterized protein YchJ